MSLPKNLILKQMEIGPLNNFLYFIGDKESKEIAVVDPAWDVPYLCKEIEKNDYKVSSIFLTHGHPDHVNGLEEILKRYDVPVYISKHEHIMFKPVHPNMVEVDDRAKLKIGNIVFDCILTPGHSPGCHLFKYENVVIAGDAIFIDGCGRCDLPGSSPKAMYNSLYNVIMKFPDDTIIYPGHNYGPTPYATVASQKETNPYLNCKSQEEFLMHRMGIAF
jgi:hydroxyacylglutathione hydrolase